MSLLNIQLIVLLLLLSIPIGFLLSYLARDELISGRKWFVALMIITLILGIGILILQEYSSALTCLFILVVSFIAYRKSFDKNWTKKAFK